MAIADVNLGVASTLPFNDSDAEKENAMKKQKYNEIHETVIINNSNNRMNCSDRT